MKTKWDISEIKFNVLSDAISFIDIVDVIERVPNENWTLLYIKAKSLTTVNTEELSRICKKYSTNKVFVEFQMPSIRVINEKNEENKDLVLISIELETKFDPESFIIFG